MAAWHMPDPQQMTTSNGTTKPFTIVVGVDYSDLGEQALESGFANAGAHPESRLHVIHVLGARGTQLGSVVAPDLTAESERLREHVQLVLTHYLEGRADQTNSPIERVTIHIGLYDAAGTISQLAQSVDADLVVVGTHGRRGVKHLLLGSVAEATVREAPCPVLVVRPRASVDPEIEAACPECLRARETSHGEELWCAQHGEHHGRRHTYRVGSTRSSHQSGLLFPV